MQRLLDQIRVACCVACIFGDVASAAAQSALRFVPRVRSAYQQRAEAIAKGAAGNVFLGSASVAPAYGFPWMVSLQIRSAQRVPGHFCGGVAVAPSWVLTAAHCVVAAHVGRIVVNRAVDTSGVAVLAKTNALAQGGRIGTVDRIIINPGFRVTRERVPENDLALLHVTGLPPLVPIERPPQSAVNDLLKEDNIIRIFGWGTSSFDPEGAVSNTLLYAFVPIEGHAKCNAPTVYNGLVTDTMFCAGLGVADSCQGDSGGPAIAYINGGKYLVGITSWGVGCSNKKYPGVYVNVAAYSRWIDETVATAK
jgi:secreted trypsin-like serine protease